MAVMKQSVDTTQTIAIFDVADGPRRKAQGKKFKLDFFLILFRIPHSEIRILMKL
jgi:hypothetical protein